MLDLADLQRRAGATVEFWGMEHPDDDPHTYADHFAPHMELDPPPAGLGDRLVTGGRMLWNRHAAAGLARTIEAFRPQVIHAHNIYHQLSPAILRAATHSSTPVVMTLHDYKLACPTYQFLRDGAVCQECLGGGFHRAVVNRCQSGSLVQSALLAAETGLHRQIKAYRRVDRFVCPSEFLARKMREAGVFPDKLRTIPHFVDVGRAIARPADFRGTGALFVGRLAPEKGVDVAIRAMRLVPEHIDLTIVGDGPERARLEALAQREAPGRVRFTGRVDRNRVAVYMSRASALVVPSVWFENQPMNMLEASVAGLPSIASELGGMAELIDHGRTGWLVPPNDEVALAEAISHAAGDPALASKMGDLARARVLDIHDPARHVEALAGLYEEIIG